MTVFRVSPHVEVGRATYKCQSWREALQHIVEVWGRCPVCLQPYSLVTLCSTCTELEPEPIAALLLLLPLLLLFPLPPRALVGLADDSELTFLGVTPPPQPVVQ